MVIWNETDPKMLSMLQTKEKVGKCCFSTGSSREKRGFCGNGGVSAFCRRSKRPSKMEVGSSARSSMGYLTGFAFGFPCSSDAVCDKAGASPAADSR